MRFTDGINSPPIFRKWAGIYTLAATLQRNVWIQSNGQPLYPHLYTILTGPPGVGKGQALTRCLYFLRELTPDVHVAYSSLTTASLIDDLAQAHRRHIRMNEDPAVVAFNSLAICSTELGVLLPSYDNAFMNKLQDLYDCITYSEKRRGRDINIEIKNPQLNIIAGCTPAYLQNTLPEGAWAEGFTARCIFVYSGEEVLNSPFDESKYNESLRDDMLKRLKKINKLYGPMRFTTEAKQFFEAWLFGGREPVPDHPKLFNYKTRRHLNLLKLAVISSVAERDDLIVDLSNLQCAFDWLVEVEHYMPDIFKAMSNTSHSQLLTDTWHYVFTAWQKDNKRPVSEARVLNFVAQRTPAHLVKYVLEVLEKSKYLRKKLGPGGFEYEPADPKIIK